MVVDVATCRLVGEVVVVVAHTVAGGVLKVLEVGAVRECF